MNRIAEIDGMIEDLRKERNQLAEQEFQGEVLPKMRSMIGNTYKYRNSYSCPHTDADYWFLYLRLSHIEDDCLIGFGIQKDCHGKISVELRTLMLDNVAMHTPITQSEYLKAVVPLLAEIQSLAGVP